MAKLVIEIDGKQAKAQAQELEAVLRRLGVQAKTTGDDIDGVSDSARENARDSGVLGEVLGSLGGQYLSVAAAVGVAVSAFTLAGKAIASSVKEAASAADVLAQVEAGLRSTKGGSGQSIEGLQSMAKELQKVSVYGDDAILKMQSVLLTFTSIRGDKFREASQAVLDLSARLGTDLQSSALMVGKALNDPVEGMTALTRAGIQFTDAQKATVRQMVETNNVAGAQAVILSELRTQFGGSAAAAADAGTGPFTQLKNAVGDLFEAVGEGLLPGLNELAGSLTELAQREDFVNALTAMGTALGKLIELTAAGVDVLLRFQKAVTDFNAENMIRVLDHLGPGGAQAAGMLRDFQFGKPDDNRERVTVAPIQRMQIEQLTEAERVQRNFDAALRQTEESWKRQAKATEEAKRASEEYKRAAEQVADVQKRIADHQAAAELAEFTLAMMELEGNTGEWMPDIIERGPEIRAELSAQEQSLKAWGDEFNEAVKGVEGTARDLIDAAFSTEEAWSQIELDHAVEEVNAELKKAEQNFEQIKRAAQDAAVEGVQGAFADAFHQLLTEGEITWESIADSLLQTFARIASELLAEWLTLELAKTKITLQQAAIRNAAESGGGGGGASGGGGGWMGSVAKLFKGGGSSSSGASGAGLSGSAMAGIAAFAVVAAIVAYNKHQRSEKDKQRYGTFSGVSGYGGSFGAGYQGRLNETGSNIASAMASLTQTLIDSSRAYIEGAMNAQVNIRNDKKSFQAMVDGELVGTFKTANEAIVAAIKTMFLRKADLDPAIRQVLENSTATDPEALARSVELVQGVLDEIRGITAIEATLQALPGKIRAMVGDLQMAGIEFGKAITMAHEWGLVQFRGAWDAISGQERSPAEERAMRERQKELLLDQMKLERLKLEQDITVLKAKAQIARGGAGLARAEIAHGVAHLRGQRALVSGEANLIQAQAGVWTNYLNERANFVEAEAGIYGAEIALLEKTLADLDALIKEVESTPIRLGGIGGAAANDNINIGRRGLALAERRTSALEEIRRLQRELVLGDLSPYNAEQKVDAAKAEYDRIAAKAAAGNVAAMERLPEVARTYLDLYRSAYGTTGDYGNVFNEVNNLLSEILRQNGMRPVEISQQADANAQALTRALKRDSRGKLHTRAEELEAELVENRRELRRIYDAIERQNNSANNNQPPQTVVVLPPDQTPRGPQRFRRSA